MNIGYVRVSTAEQNEDRQIEAISKAVDHIDKWKCSKGHECAIVENGRKAAI